MAELYFMVTVADRNQSRKFMAFYKQYGVSVSLRTLGHGTAGTDILDAFSLEATQKILIFSVVTGTSWAEIRRGLHREMRVDIPGTGIAFIVPVSSIGGGRQLQFLTGEQSFEKGEESVLKDTKYELVTVIANLGYTEEIMEAARGAGAGGGTVLHAKGTGMEGAEKFLGVSLADEKELVLIVVKSRDKNRIMQAIMQNTGLQSRAKSIVFSLPVTETAGLPLTDLDEEQEKG